MLFLIFIFVSFSATILPPNNIVCFPERDFCTIESFVDKIGETLLVEVVRNGGVIGSANGTVSGDPDAFEVNHPGGLCWGDGTTLKVTPDLQAGDLVRIKSGSLLLGDMVISNGYISSYSLSGSTVTISGFVDTSTVLTSNIEVRIVNPLLLNTTVAKRQVSAIVGPLVTNVGFSSGINIVGTSFTATFVFNTQEAANIAGSGESYSLSMWMITDPAGFRQGLTISEYGEVGGPWSSLCPPGPQNLGSPLINEIAVSDNIIKWSPGKDIIGSPPTTGFSLNVIRNDKVYGYRVDSTINQLSFDLTPLTGGDVIEVRSMIGTKMSDAFVITYQPQNLTPTISSLPVNNIDTIVQTDLVVLDSNTGQIVYTLDGSPVLDVNNKISPTAILYYKPIHVTQEFTLKAVSFDRSGNVSTELVGKFAPVILLPQPITIAPKAIVENGGITLSWTKPNDATISSFGVEIFTPTGVKVGITRIVVATTLIIKDLVPGTSYQFSVITQNTVGSSVSSPKTESIIFPLPTDSVIITSARYIQNKQFRINGTGNMAATVTLYSTNPNGTIGTIIFNRGTTTPITAPIICAGGICTFTINVRNTSVPLVNPGRIFIKSSRGGVSGPFIVA